MITFITVGPLNIVFCKPVYMIAVDGWFLLRFYPWRIVLERNPREE